MSIGYYEKSTKTYKKTAGGGYINVDDSMSSTSTNPVQNKVLVSELGTKSEVAETGYSLEYADSNLTLKNKEGETLSTVKIEGGSSIDLPDVSGATCAASSRSATIKWSDPNDVVVESVVLAKWVGTKVVRKVGTAPESVSDGTLVLDNTTRNAYSETGYTDTGLTNGVVYYYRFFPYTKSSTTNGSSVIAEPQLITISVPTQSGTLVYNGVAQTPTWSGYDENKMTMEQSGQVNSGTYSTSFTPKEDYKWSDDTTGAKSVSWTINKATLSSSISQSGSLTYSGSAQTPSFSGYDSNTMDIGGDTSGMNAGTYTSTFTPKENYMWEGGSTSAISVSWSIGKADGSITLSASSVTLNSSTLTTSVTATVVGDYTLSASTSASSIATASISGNTITISNVNQTSGSATITVSANATTNYNAPTSKTIAVTASFLEIVAFSSGSDAQIEAMINAHYAGTIDIASYWAVGDSRSITGSDGTTATWKIIGIKHDDLATAINGVTKAAVTIWKSDNWTSSVMNSSYNSYTYADYANSTGRTNTRALKTNLSSGLQSLIKDVTKTSAYPTNSSNTQALKTSTENLFLLSNYELFGSTYSSYVTVQDGNQYAYMVNNRPSSGNIWSRSGFWRSGGSSAFFVRCYSGSRDCDFCDGSRSLAPACCL